MKAYNNQEVIEAINSFSTESCILKGKQYDSEWTVNELLYCLESVASINNELYFSCLCYLIITSTAAPPLPGSGGIRWA